jgi:glycosyltransferase involved in cell wall biosynthesis
LQQPGNNVRDLYKTAGVCIVRAPLSMDAAEKRMHMASTPTVSVVIPARNAAATVKRALASVLAQTRPADEIIVADDASGDATAVVALSCPGVRLVRLEEHRGAAAARNAAIAAAKGEWIAFLDADDVWQSEKLECQLACVRDDVSLISCGSEEFAPDGRSLGDTFRGRPVSEGGGAWKALLRRNFVATPTVLAPRALLLQLGGFDEALPVGEDQDMWIRLALKGTLVCVPRTLAEVHVQSTSLSRYRASDQGRHVLPMVRRHVEALRHRLSRDEARAILAERYANAGHIALAHGDVVRAGAFLSRALMAGYRPSSWTTLRPARQAS